MPKILNPDIYKIARLIANEKYSKPSAYKSMFLVKTYKELGGQYADDGTPKNLDRWKKEQWKDIAGLDYPVYRPTKKISKKTPLTVSEIKPSSLVKQSILKQYIKGSKNLPPFVKAKPTAYKKGGKRTAKEIKNFLDASYQDNPPENIDDFILDNQLSNDTVKVYYNPKSKEAVVIHRGTKGLTDWGNNLAYALGVYEYTQRYKKGKTIQDLAEAKYGKENISTLGHSQGSILSRKLGKDTKEIINVNPAYIFENPAKNEYNIRSSSDIVSGLFAPVAKTREILFPKYSKSRDITIPSKSSIDVVGEHSYSILERLGEKEIGQENKRQENKISNNDIMKDTRQFGLDEKIKQLVFLGIPQDAVALLLHTGNLEIVWNTWISGQNIKPLLSQVLNSLEPQKSKKISFNLNPSNTDEDPLKEMSEPYNVEDALAPESELVEGGMRRGISRRLRLRKKRGGGAGTSTQVTETEEARFLRNLNIIEQRLTRNLEAYNQSPTDELIPEINRDYNNRNRILRYLNRIRGIRDDSIPTEDVEFTTAQIEGVTPEVTARRANSQDDMEEAISIAEPVGRGRKKRGGGAGASTPVTEEERLQRSLNIIEPRLIRNLEAYDAYDLNPRDELIPERNRMLRDLLIPEINWDYNNRNRILRDLNRIRGIRDDSIPTEDVDYIIPILTTAQIEGVTPEVTARRANSQDDMEEAISIAEPVGRGRKKRGGMIVNRGTNPYGVRGGRRSILDLPNEVFRNIIENLNIASLVNLSQSLTSNQHPHSTTRRQMVNDRIDFIRSQSPPPENVIPTGATGRGIGRTFKKMGKSFKPISKALGNVNLTVNKNLAKVGTAVNPMTYALGNKDIRNTMIKSGEITHDYLLPAVVSAGKPIFDATAMVGSTMLTGNPVLGKAVADTVWNEFVSKKNADPRDNQKSKELGVLSETFGQALSKPYSAALAGNGRKNKLLILYHQFKQQNPKSRIKDIMGFARKMIRDKPNKKIVELSKLFIKNNK